jgi:murein DD-endopeptidase MepM/ murein hydrolase activator NlpD
VLVAASGVVDRDGPALAVDNLPTGSISGYLTFQLSTSDAAPGLGGWTAAIDNQPVEVLLDDSGLARIDVAGLADGPHTLHVAAWDRAWTPNWSRASATFAVDQTPPTLRAAARSLTARQGKLHVVLVDADEPIDAPQGTFLGQPLTFHLLDDVGLMWRALVGVPIRSETGPQTLTLQVSDPAGNDARASVEVDVAEGRFPRGGTIKLRPDQVAARNDEDAKAKMRAERDEAYAWDHAAQLWQGPMMRPVARGRISSPFGRYRTYSDGKKSHHTGTDIAAPRGTPVLAANAGEVRVAGAQAIFGNVVIVHHGQGLSTSYNHLSRIDVAVGQRVARGEQVGAVGTTGQSTGPHLHWSLVAGDVAVDAMPLLDDDLMPGDEPDWRDL